MGGFGPPAITPAMTADATSNRRLCGLHWPGGFRAYTSLHGAFLVLYATLGRGFAYVGANPFYVGELLFLAGLSAAACTRRLHLLVRTRLGVLMLGFVAWQMVCTVPYLPTYRIDTPRDASIWGYGAFAWIVAALVLRLDGIIEQVVRWFGTFAGFYVFLGPVCAVATQYYFAVLPSLPGPSVTVPSLKCGDLCVHLAGITAFLLSGLSARKYWWLLPIAVGVIAGGSVGRGGLLAFGISITIATALTLRQERVFAAGFALVSLIALLLAFDPEISIPGRADRKISVSQVLDNVSSIGSDNEDVGGTKRWRLNWWDQIIGYTVYGEYFWTGKGYGINLAVSDRIAADVSLRSPHNSHLTLLARSGVPGFLLWAVVQLAWLATMLSAFVRARVLGLRAWSGLFCWLVAYWAAFMVDAAFDVALEGPMLAIPFWSVVGFGWGATIVFLRRTRPNRAQRRERYRIAIGLEAEARAQKKESGEDLPVRAASPP
jgi:hypothetical protein